MKKYFLLVLLSSLLFTNNAKGQARGIKIGYIDMEYILENRPDHGFFTLSGVTAKNVAHDALHVIFCHGIGLARTQTRFRHAVRTKQGQEK